MADGWDGRGRGGGYEGCWELEDDVNDVRPGLVNHLSRHRSSTEKMKMAILKETLESDIERSLTFSLKKCLENV